MNEQTTKLKCWKCKDIFHIRVKSSEGLSLSQVAPIKPCPYCQAQCRVILGESQVLTRSNMRGGAESKDESWFENLPPGALTDHVFDSEPCPEKKA